MDFLRNDFYFSMRLTRGGKEIRTNRIHMEISFKLNPYPRWDNKDLSFKKKKEENEILDISCSLLSKWIICTARARTIGSNFHQHLENSYFVDGIGQKALERGSAYSGVSNL